MGRPGFGQPEAWKRPAGGLAAANGMKSSDLWRLSPDWPNHQLMRTVGWKSWTVAGAVAAALPLCACISHTRPESAALPQPWPQPPPNLAAYGPPAPDYPSVGGDILKGSTPADLAEARAAAFRPLDLPDTPDQGPAKGQPPAQPRTAPPQP